jgi:peptidyl-prolyl cis-trans isomerase SurA
MGRVENVNELRDKIKEMMLMDRARQHLVSNVFRKKIANPTEAELRRFYTENPSFFYAPEAVKIQQLVIRVKEDADFDALEKVEKLLKEIAKKAKAGENFSKLIAKYAEISYRSNNGFVSASFLKREELKSLFPKYVKYAFKLNAGEISPVIIDGQKRIIIKIAEKKSKQLRPFDEVKKLVKQYIFSEKGMKLLTEWVSEQYRKGNIKIYYDRLRIAR